MILVLRRALQLSLAAHLAFRRDLVLIPVERPRWHPKASTLQEREANESLRRPLHSCNADARQIEHSVIVQARRDRGAQERFHGNGTADLTP